MLNILVLHGLGPRPKWFTGVSDVELMFPKYGRGAKYFTHNCYASFPKLLKSINFDGIIFMSTFIDYVVAYGCSSRWMRQFNFIRQSGATKIAFAQDDYWFSEVRDEFYTKFQIDRLYSVCPQQSWSELFPKYLKTKGDVKQGFTTYITPETRELTKYQRPWDQRYYDVVYRAKKIPSAPNYFGYVKGVLGELFLSNIDANKYTTNISTDPNDLIYGEPWKEFVADSRSILGSNSGSSVNLRNYEVEKKLRNYQTNNPNSPWDVVASDVFDKNDINKAYTAISPRNIEAAMLETLQILTPGEYSGILRPDEHFLALDADFKNARSIMKSLQDVNRCKQIVENCRTVILETKELQFETLLFEVESLITTKHHDELTEIRKLIITILYVWCKLSNEIRVMIKWYVQKLPRFIFSKLTPQKRLYFKHLFRK